MAPKLEQVFAMRGYMSKENTINLKAIKGGPVRVVVPITHGFIKGSGLDAEILPGGGDWILVSEHILKYWTALLSSIPPAHS